MNLQWAARVPLNAKNESMECQNVKIFGSFLTQCMAATNQGTPEMSGEREKQMHGPVVNLYFEPSVFDIFIVFLRVQSFLLNMFKWFLKKPNVRFVENFACFVHV